MASSSLVHWMVLSFVLGLVTRGKDITTKSQWDLICNQSDSKPKFSKETLQNLRIIIRSCRQGENYTTPFRTGMINGATNEYTPRSEREKVSGKNVKITPKTKIKDDTTTCITQSLQRNHGNGKQLETNVVCDGSSDEEDLYGEPSRDSHLQSSAPNIYHPRDARYPRFTDRIERTFSFGAWENPFRCSTNEAAEAGLFYPGEGRDLLCHYCGTSVPPLKRSDDAWIEHARANPTCAFVLSSKGENFVKMVREMYDSFEMDDSILEQELMGLEDSSNVRVQHQASGAQQTTRPKDPATSASRESTRNQQSQPLHANETARASNVPDPSAIPRQTQPIRPLPTSVQRTTRASRPPRTPKRQVQAREVRSRLDMEWAQKLITMGYSADLVGAVIAEQMIYNGDDFRSFKDMLMATVEAADMGDEYPVRHYALGLAQNPALSSGSEGASTSQQPPSTATPRSGSSGSATPSSRSGSNSAMSLSVGASSWTETAPNAGGNGDSGNSSATKNIESSVANLSLESKSLEKENRELKDKKMCKICYERDANMVFLPCGHLVVCENCNIRLNECPLCRRHIQGALKTFLS